MNFFDLLFEAKMNKELLDKAREATAPEDSAKYEIKEPNGKTRIVDQKEYDAWERGLNLGVKISRKVDDWVKTRKNMSQASLNLDKSVFDANLKKIADALDPQGKQQTIPDLIEELKKRAESAEEGSIKKQINLTANDVGRYINTSDVFFMQLLYILYKKIFYHKGLYVPVNRNDQLKTIFDGIKDRKSFERDIIPDIATANNAKTKKSSIPRQLAAVARKIEEEIKKKEEENSSQNQFVDENKTNILRQFSKEISELKNKLATTESLIKNAEERLQNAKSERSEILKRKEIDPKKQNLSEDEYSTSLANKLDQASKNVVNDIRKKDLQKRHISQEQFLKMSTNNFNIKAGELDLENLKILKGNLESRLEYINNRLEETKKGKEQWRENRSYIDNISKELEKPEVFKQRVAFMKDEELNKLIDEYIQLKKDQTEEKSGDTVIRSTEINGKTVYLDGFDFGKDLQTELAGLQNKKEKTPEDNKRIKAINTKLKKIEKDVNELLSLTTKKKKTAADNQRIAELEKGLDKVKTPKEFDVGKSKLDRSKAYIPSLKQFIENLKKSFLYSGHDIYTNAARVINQMFFGNDVVPTEHTAGALFLAGKRDRLERERQERIKKQQEEEDNIKKINTEFFEKLGSTNRKDITDKIESNDAKINEYREKISAIESKLDELDSKRDELRKDNLSDARIKELNDELKKIEEAGKQTPKQKARVKEIRKELEKISKSTFAIDDMNRQEEKLRNGDGTAENPGLNKLKKNLVALEEFNKNMKKMIVSSTDFSKVGDNYLVTKDFSSRLSDIDNEFKNITDWQRIKKIIRDRRNKKK